MFGLLVCGLFGHVGLGVTMVDEGTKRIDNKISITARTSKEAYVVGEPIALEVAIANHDTEPVYSFLSESDFRGGFSMVKDANGTTVSGDAPPEPNMPFAPYYYMEKDGKKILTVPVYRIDGNSVMTRVIDDALKLHHKYLAEGTYYLSIGDLEIARGLTSVIVREGLPYKLWVDPTCEMIRKRYPVNDVKVHIRKADAEKALSPKWQRIFSGLLLYAIGVVAVVIAGLVVLGKKRGK